jgi:hypothetical protein
MSNQKFIAILMAFMAMSFLKPHNSFAQIKTPDTSKELIEDRPAKSPGIENERAQTSSSAAPRRLQQHGIGLGLGQNFLLGNYAKYGEDKITMDLLYSYAASYSFDLLLNAHMSEHKDKNERMKVMGLTGSFKGRFVEYDNFSPYFLGGLGFYAPRAKRSIDGDYSWSDQKITFGLNFGGGLDLRLNEKYVVGVLGQLHWPFAIKQDEGSDLRGYYFKLLITGMYLF